MIRELTEKDLESFLKIRMDSLRLYPKAFGADPNTKIDREKTRLDLQSKNEENFILGYFELGVRSQEWMGNRVIKYHRNIEDYWRIVKQAGFSVEEIKEGCPQETHFLNREEYERRKRIPLFLIIKAVKM